MYRSTVGLSKTKWNENDIRDFRFFTSYSKTYKNSLQKQSNVRSIIKTTFCTVIIIVSLKWNEFISLNQSMVSNPSVLVYCHNYLEIPLLTPTHYILHRYLNRKYWPPLITVQWNYLQFCRQLLKIRKYLLCMVRKFDWQLSANQTWRHYIMKSWWTRIMKNVIVTLRQKILMVGVSAP